ncbi:MAG: hypothetical protein K8W52_32525 [Deltaproteobacteria bacterium]|nr:hypothetical protein [Deltaproteobacteria bacterium]
MARAVVLSASVAVVLGATVYLFVQVRAAPASPSADKIADARARPKPAPETSGDPWAGQALSPQAREEAVRANLVGPSETRVEPSAHEPPPVLVEGVTPNASIDPDQPKVDGQDEANRLFDRGDYDDAQKQAVKMLESDPTNARMLRIVVSSACFMGDADKAQKYWSQLTEERDRAQMQVRCGRYSIQFKP